MAMRGEFLFSGYMPGRGVVRVFHDLDSTTHVFAMLASGQSIYTTRDRIQARKTVRAPKGELAQQPVSIRYEPLVRAAGDFPAPPAQPTLF